MKKAHLVPRCNKGFDQSPKATNFQQVLSAISSWSWNHFQKHISSWASDPRSLCDQSSPGEMVWMIQTLFTQTRCRVNDLLLFLFFFGATLLLSLPSKDRSILWSGDILGPVEKYTCTPPHLANTKGGMEWLGRHCLTYSPSSCYFGMGLYCRQTDLRRLPSWQKMDDTEQSAGSMAI